ncbi:hypothetical protein ACIQOV_04235, partial [Kitasatospora sp. NPDC091257]|uniref:hypothetical protein n=1 Tax=Kitasatospora sp. NPDC091257 TaxID=3364084 RepID=UPI00382FBCEB
MLLRVLRQRGGPGLAVGAVAGVLVLAGRPVAGLRGRSGRVPALVHGGRRVRRDGDEALDRLRHLREQLPAPGLELLFLRLEIGGLRVVGLGGGVELGGPGVDLGGLLPDLALLALDLVLHGVLLVFLGLQLARVRVVGGGRVRL